MASGGENYGYSSKNNNTEASGWSNNENSVGNISNSTGVGNGNKISAQSAQERQLLPIPSLRSEVQPYNGVKYYGYNESGNNNKISVGNIENNSNTGIGNCNKIWAQSTQDQPSAQVPSPRSGVQPSGGGNYGYSSSGNNKIDVSGRSKENTVGSIKNNTTEVSGLGNGNSVGNISNTVAEKGNKISAKSRSAQEEHSAPVSFLGSGVQPSGGGNYGYSASGNNNKINVSGLSKDNSVGSIKNNTSEVSGLSNGISVGNINNTVAENGKKISTQSAQEQQSAPVPFPGSGVQPSGGGNYGYSASGKNKINVSGWSEGNSVGNIVQSAQGQQSAAVPSMRIGVQPSSGGNYRYSGSDNNNRNPVGNIGNISNTGVGDNNKTLAQSAPIPIQWSGVQHSGGGNYGYRANHDNNMSVSGGSNGNSVGNIRNTGVGTNTSESTPRRSCCSCLICS